MRQVTTMASHRVIAAVIFFCILGVALWPVTTPNGVATRSGQCRNSLKQIAVALHNYHDDFGAFPPAFVANSAGKPLHSWRVLILPYLEQQSLYDSYRFDEAWNSPSNSAIGRQIPETFKCPSFAVAQHNTTNELKTTYVIAQADTGVFNASSPVTLGEISDPLDETLLVVEVHGSAVH